MTDTDLNTAALALAGWTELTLTAPDRGSMKPRLIGISPHGIKRICPSYLHGPEALGNVAGLEAMLTDEQHELFRDELYQITSVAADETMPTHAYSSLLRDRHYISATPRQRLHALLRVLKPELFK